MTTPFWLTAYLDLAADEHERGILLWQRLTGYRASAARGAHDEYVSLLPPDGDDYLDVQRLGSGPSRVHLVVHVDDVRAAAEAATGIGAAVTADEGDYLTLTSPGGFTFCFVSHPATTLPAATAWPDGSRSRVDQVCLDIPPSVFDEEFAFWERVTGWEPRPPRPDVEFARLTPPPGQPLQLLLQRLDEEEPAVRAHLDWCATERDAEVDRHVAAGATLVKRFDRGWTVLTGPDGFTYCVTERSPQEG
ncbi:VOC family protein [Nocardioides sp.]|uniref:VOC family protein n=1 Tax=Nocardioides sp. TaxID=35761 RepID=UPI001A2BCC83|nr:VOC family protein [Nocardioides sp.]MBJ7356569.1 VOC family protein [Nocardioides sp.]